MRKGFIIGGLAVLGFVGTSIANNDSNHVPTYLTLIFYSLYGLLVYHQSVRRNPLVAHKIIPWLDLLWYVPLIAFASQTNSLFYYFFFFSITVASFSWGLRQGLRLTLASAAIYTIVRLLSNGETSTDYPLLSSIYLLIFGYIIARWGGYHTELKNRLKLLKDLFQSSLRHRSDHQSDPREYSCFLRC